MKPRILIACEFSGIVRDAFISRGADAISCDLLPTERPGPHIQDDATKQLRRPWDMVIAFPPCTYLTYAGNAYWNDPGRANKRRDALKFFLRCYRANAPMVAVENPFGWPVAIFKKPSQIINPFDFGEAIRKRTCLWLRGLPMLMRGDDLFGGEQSTPLPPPEPIYVGTRIATGKRKARYMCDTGLRRWHWTEPQSSAGKNRAHERSRSFAGIANAMASQWHRFAMRARQEGAA